MRPLACWMVLAALPALSAPEPLAQDRLYEKGMSPLGIEGWFTMLGNWDKEGRPVVLDLSYTHKWDPDSGTLHFRSPHRVMLMEGDVVKDYAATVTQSTSGQGRQWFAHITFGDCCGVPPFREFRIITQGEKDLPGRLDYNSPGTPQLKVWEEPSGRIRWEVREAWQVKVEATVNDGESWTLLGAENSGQYDLKPLLSQEPVLRITGFRGLRCFAEAYVPGQGFLPEARPYLQPTCMVGTARHQGAMSGWPTFIFGPVVDPPIGYQGRVKVYLNDKRLPFDLGKLFPGKFIQKVFQAEWSEPSRGTDPRLLMQVSMLRDPNRWNVGWLYRIKPDGKGGWGVENTGIGVGRKGKPKNNPGYPNNIFVSGRMIYEDKMERNKKSWKEFNQPWPGLEVNFSYYFVLVGE